MQLNACMLRRRARLRLNPMPRWFPGRGTAFDAPPGGSDFLFQESSSRPGLVEDGACQSCCNKLCYTRLQACIHLSAHTLPHGTPSGRARGCGVRHRRPPQGGQPRRLPSPPAWRRELLVTHTRPHGERQATSSPQLSSHQRCLDQTVVPVRERQRPPSPARSASESPNPPSPCVQANR